MLGGLGDSITLRRVRLIGGPSGGWTTAEAVRAPLGSALATADFRPRGLSAAAIVCMRRLPAPAPWSARREGHSLQARLQWEAGVRARVDAAARGAARPAAGPVPAGAEAVVFADRAELLACLAAEVCAGVAVGRWWWQALLPRSGSIREALVAAWLESPEAAPTALDHLDQQGQAVQFLKVLSAVVVHALRQAVLRTHGLGLVAAALDTAPAAGDRVRPSDALTALAPRPPDLRDAATAPWEAWTRGSLLAGLDPERAALLGIGLGLRRAPAEVRMPAFARAVRRWRNAVMAQHRPTMGARLSPETRADATPTTVPPTPARSQATAKTVPPRYPPDIAARSSAHPPPIAPNAPATPGADSARSQEPGPVGRPHQGPGAGSPDTSPPITPTRPEAPAASHPAAPVERPRPAPDVRHAPGTVASVPPDSPSLAPATGLTWDTGTWAASATQAIWLTGGPLLEAQVATRLGGLFYLVNLGLALELYGDFTQPLRPGISLPLWDFVALLGECLAGARVRKDPVWPLLASLAGRDPLTPPGAAFTPPRQWRLPPAWLAAFPEPGTWRWTAAEGRLRLRHPHGFLVADVPLAAGDARAPARAVARPYHAVARFRLRHDAHAPALAADRAQLHGAAPARERWLGWVAAYARARLRRALGVVRTRDLARVLLAHRAQVLVAATRVDVVFRLADLPMEVRLAGLDRDPGWVPAAGRAVAFHFD